MIRLSDRSIDTAFLALIVMSLGLAGCGKPSAVSGTYEADMGDGGAVRIIFTSGDKAKVSLIGPGGQGEMSHNTVYTVDGKKLHFTSDEPFGAPMDLSFENGELTDGTGTVFRKK